MTRQQPRCCLGAVLLLSTVACTDESLDNQLGRVESMAPACWNPVDPSTHYVDIWDSTDPSQFSVIGYIKVIRTAQTGAQHYNYFSASAHPGGVNTNARYSNLWIHESSSNGDLTFSFTFGRDNSGVFGYRSLLDFRIVDSDTDPYVSQSDDPGEATESPAGSNAFIGDYSYGDNTDGIAVSGLGGSEWTIIVDSVDFGSNINSWFAASGEIGNFSDDVALTLDNEYRLTPACNEPSGLPVRVEPPIAICQDRAVEADDSCRGCASIDGGSTAADGGPVIVTESPGCEYGLGDTEVTLTATDESGESASCTAMVTVLDATPPGVSVNEMLLMSYPRDCGLEDYSLADCATITDNCDISPDINTLGTIVSISSDEVVIDANHDCNATPELCIDIKIIDNSHFQVRNNRDSYGDGRVYTIDFTVADSAGNASQVYSCQVGVRLFDNHVPTGGPSAYTVYP
ncbi:MAG: HYR domain-containing protein [Proteobacteria bacterium]|nr:HYR domain-containing protein [Pseudomonadota bacterium]